MLDHPHFAAQVEGSVQMVLLNVPEVEFMHELVLPERRRSLELASKTIEVFIEVHVERPPVSELLHSLVINLG